MGGGGSSGDDYGARADAMEAKKAQARAALNAAFGIAPPASAAPARPGGIIGRGYDMVDEPAPAPDTSLADQATANKTARDTLYDTVRNNAFTAGRRGFDEKRTDAARNNKFALYAQGLQGGSVDVDQNALIDRTYNQGLLDLGGKADAAKADLKSNDEQARLQLLQSIDAGMDQNSALSSALGQLSVNSDKASAAAQGTNLGDLFNDAGLLYTQSQASRGKQAALANNPFAYYARGGRTNNPGAGGVISNVGV